ncbi:MAG: LicD family protein [Alphaproteobacteria bacterium]
MKIASKLFIVLSLCLSLTNSLFAMSQEDLDVVHERSCLTRVAERAKISAVRAICEVKWLVPEGIAKIRNANSISSLLGGIANFVKVPLTGLKVGLCEMFWPWQQQKVSRNAHFTRPEIQGATCKVDEESKDYVIALYRMMKDVKRAFSKEKVPYFATNGTLLGCVRHRGIIPGDDDLDVSVTEEYEELMPKVFARLPKGYKVVTIKNRLEYPSEVAKLIFRVAKSIFSGNIQYADRISDDVEMHIYILVGVLSDVLIDLKSMVKKPFHFVTYS